MNHIKGIRAIIYMIGICFALYMLYDIKTYKNEDIPVEDREASGSAYNLIRLWIDDDPLLREQYNEAIEDGYISHKEFDYIDRYYHRKQLRDAIEKYE